MSVIRTGCWISDNNEFTNYTELGDGSVAYQFLAEELVPDTHYYLKAWVENERGITYSLVSNFTTASDIPVVSSLTASGIDGDSVTLTCVASGSYYQIESYTFTIKDQSGATVATQTQASNIWSYDSLTPNTTYSIYATATNTNGNTSALYDGGTFTTSVVAPTVVLNSLVAESATRAELSYTVTSTAALQSVSLEVATNPQFTDSTTTALPTTGGTQTCYVSTTDTYETYYVRVIAKNSGGTTTSSALSIEPLAGVSITDITNITESSAVVTITVS